MHFLDLLLLELGKKLETWGRSFAEFVVFGDFFKMFGITSVGIYQTNMLTNLFESCFYYLPNIKSFYYLPNIKSFYCLPNIKS